MTEVQTTAVLNKLMDMQNEGKPRQESQPQAAQQQSQPEVEEGEAIGEESQNYNPNNQKLKQAALLRQARRKSKKINDQAQQQEQLRNNFLTPEQKMIKENLRNQQLKSDSASLNSLGSALHQSGVAGGQAESNMTFDQIAAQRKKWSQGMDPSALVDKIIQVDPDLQSIYDLQNVAKQFNDPSITLDRKIHKLVNILQPFEPVLRARLIQLLTTTPGELLAQLAFKNLVQLPQSKSEPLYSLTKEGFPLIMQQFLAALAGQSFKGSQVKFQTFMKRYNATSDQNAALSQTLAKIKKIGPQAQGLTTYLKPGSFLSSFPHWAAGQASKLATLHKKADMNQIAIDERKKQSSPFFSTLRSLNPSGASWDAVTQQWQGPLVQKKIDQAVSHALNIEKKLKVGEKIISRTATRQQIDENVPKFIKAIVKANKDLSTVGIGPISNQQVGFYAGRWIDTATGRVRVLPQADSKYINPSSLKQKLGYLQAKLINHWNQLMDTYVTYKKMSKVDVQTYKTRAIDRLKKSLTIDSNMRAFNNFINNTITRFMVAKSMPNSDLQTNATYLILNKIGQQALTVIYQKDPTYHTAQTTTDLSKLRDKFDSWAKKVNWATNQLIERVRYVKLVPAEYLAITNKLNGQRVRLTGYMASKMKNALKSASKMATIPDQINANEIYTFQKAQIQRGQKLSKQFQSQTFAGLKQDNIKTSNTLAQKLTDKLMSNSSTEASSAISSFSKLKGGVSIPDSYMPYKEKKRPMGQMLRRAVVKSQGSSEIPSYLHPFMDRTQTNYQNYLADQKRKKEKDRKKK